MPINSRAKGAAGELEWRDVLRDHGYEAERGQQHAGGADAPDVKHNIPGVHFEVKRVEAKASGSVYDWMAQAERDAGENMPVVVHRRNRKGWVAILRQKDFFELLKRAQ